MLALVVCSQYRIRRMAGRYETASQRLGGNRFANGRIDGAYPHMLSFLGSTWGKGPPRFTDDQVIEWTRNLVGKGAAVTWDAPIQPGGLIAEPFLKQLKALGKAMGKVAGDR